MRLAVLFLALCLAGCAAKHIISPGLTYEVGPECRPKVLLVGCNDASPPHCKHAVVTYQKGCEKLATK